eukprot:6159830-Prymnesium_polylepis.1
MPDMIWKTREQIFLMQARDARARARGRVAQRAAGALLVAACQIPKKSHRRHRQNDAGAGYRGCGR